MDFEKYIGEPDKERAIAAMRRQPVDRVPNGEGLIEDKHVKKMLGREAGNTMSVGGDMAKGEASSDTMRPMHADDFIEVCQIIGQDMITVEEYGTYFIHGQVVRPGEYLLGEDLMASRAIALAGGFTDIANQNGVQVIRKLEGGKTKIIKVPVATILKTGRSDKDVLLQEGDTVVVSESWF